MKKNPYIPAITVAKIAAANAEEVERKARDEIFITRNEISRLQRQRSADESVSPDALQRARTKHSEALEEFTHASIRVTETRGRLYSAEKASENWEIIGKYWEGQCESAAEGEGCSVGLKLHNSTEDLNDRE